MDIKCKTNPYYFLTPSMNKTIHFQGVQTSSGILKRVELCANQKKSVVNAGLCEDKFVKRPIASKNAIGLFGYINKCKNSVSNYIKNYKKNLKHTLDHKIVFAIIERELFGKNSIDSLTHDLDKLLLYILGVPKKQVSKFHRSISEHHIESGKKNNLRSMLCDNIASSPEFKPEKKQSLRSYFASSSELQNIEGFKDILEKYNYGENLDFNAIKDKKNVLSFSNNGMMFTIINFLTLFLSDDKTTSL